VDDEVLVDTGRIDVVDEDDILEVTEVLGDVELEVLVDWDVSVVAIDVSLRLEEETGMVTAVEPEDVASNVPELVALLWLLLATTIAVVDTEDGELAGLGCVGFGVEELEVEIPGKVELPGLDDGTWLEPVVRVLEFAENVVEVMKTIVSGLVDCGEFSDS
jgi:hypothetical protein